MKVITPYNRNEFKGPHCRKIEGFSVTIPEQSLSVKDVYDRYNQGIPLDLQEQRGIFYNLTLDDFDVTDTKDCLSMADMYNRMSDLQRRSLLEKKLNQLHPIEPNETKNPIDPIDPIDPKVPIDPIDPK